MTEYILFLVFVLVLITVFLWALQQGLSRLQKLPDFTDLEIAAMRRQLLALLGIPLFILFLVLSPLVGDRGEPYGYLLAAIIGLGSIAYISVSSIKDRVSILRGRERLPIKGTKAIWSGVMNLVIILLIGGIFIYYVLRK
jgi:hypothetical protein